MAQDKKITGENENKKITNRENETFDTGKNLYSKHCQLCHGKNGKGDGPKSANFDIRMGDFTKQEFKEKTKEEILSKINEGNHEMPSFRNKINDVEIYQIIDYIMNLEDPKEKKKLLNAEKNSNASHN